MAGAACSLIFWSFAMATLSLDLGSLSASTSVLFRDATRSRISRSRAAAWSSALGWSAAAAAAPRRGVGVSLGWVARAGGRCEPADTDGKNDTGNEHGGRSGTLRHRHGRSSSSTSKRANGAERFLDQEL